TLRGRNRTQLDFHSPRTFGTYSATMIRAALLLVLAAVGCATVLPGPRVDASVAPSPAQRWIPPRPLPASRPPEPDPALVAQLTWLLLDLGGRSADVEEADRLLQAANLNHGAAIQDLLLLVEQGYFQYQGAKALLTAAQASVKEAQTAYQAAEERRRAGVATIADVLQAKTQLSQAVLAQQQAE